MYYPFLDVKEGHHSASHNNNSDGYESGFTRQEDVKKLISLRFRLNRNVC